MSVAFTKMEGCGNDYLFVDAVRQAFPFERAAELSRAWSDRHFGVGADGLIVLVRGDAAPLRMLMWNADGSRGAMCGNGLRCFARFAAAAGHVEVASFAVETDAGMREVELLAGDEVRATMGQVTCAAPRTVAVGERTVELVPGSAGNPHAVMFVPDTTVAPVEAIGAALQRHPEFPGGVNVEFVQRLGPTRIRQRTFERGSGETLACGTGAAVAAAASRQAGLVEGPRTAVELLGGQLIVIGDTPSLAIEGPARTVFHGEIALPR